MKTNIIRSFLLLLSFCVVGTVYAAGGVVTSPTGTAPDRYVYYPGTEALAKDEIRLISCGTGLPDARRDQTATYCSRAGRRSLLNDHRRPQSGHCTT